MNPRLLITAAAAMLAAACGSSGSSPPSSGGHTSGTAALSTKKVSGLGTVLTNGHGHTLYVFAPDQAKRVTCTPGCQKVWPPLAVSAGQKPKIAGALNPSLVSTASNPAGERVVTYAGWPLYTYVADATAGTVNGQANGSSGGSWYVISPSGAVIKKPLPAQKCTKPHCGY